MNKRRGFLKAAPAVAAGLTGLGAAATVGALGTQAGERVPQGGRATPIPNMTVVTHEGEVALFNDDLVADRVVAISVMSIENESRCPVTANLARVADLLGERLGRDVHFISVTRDPVNDTPERLRAFAARFGSRPGWTFVWPEAGSLNAIENRVYHHALHGPKSATFNHGVALEKIDPRRTVDVVFYGNAGVGLWATYPSDIAAEDAARRLGWVMPGKTPSGEMQRAGPGIVTTQSLAATDNRMV